MQIDYIAHCSAPIFRTKIYTLYLVYGFGWVAEASSTNHGVGGSVPSSSCQYVEVSLGKMPNSQLLRSALCGVRARMSE